RICTGRGKKMCSRPPGAWAGPHAPPALGGWGHLPGALPDSRAARAGASGEEELARAPRSEQELSRTGAGRALVRHGSRPACIPRGPLLSTVLQDTPRRDLDVLPSLPVSPDRGEGGISDGAVSSSWPARTARQAHSTVAVPSRLRQGPRLSPPHDDGRGRRGGR